ncbi:hypothetical protein [Bradyrhizobium sp. BR 10289]|uniref:hypothetical protein n=1 Tax=Bradyrhizobium sp. BR 10289 TaxID=2749993 RepID=UPI001C64973A|nr:hypothetical protein [Bradyrhizobium sp. BR 10289]MBW7970954.1 hypothetical protein [Bradyrhizobium sp. BR 10289]
MNDETISELGGFAKDLLSSDAFKALITMYEQQCAVDMLKTKLTEERERIHAAYSGFEDFLSLVQKFAMAFEEQSKSPPAEDTTDDFDDPRVHDIYSTEQN